MSEPPPTMTIEEMARLFQYNTDHFRDRVLPKLTSEPDFPRKLPGMPRWSRRAVLEWIDQQNDHAMEAAR